MTNYKGHIFQLGKCGMEQIGSLGDGIVWTQTQFCGKIAGGAAFCNGFNCYTYSDETGKILQKPTVSSFLKSGTQNLEQLITGFRKGREKASKTSYLRITKLLV